MVSVGQVTNFWNLLKTGPDEHSDLNGVDLAERKVRAWVCMGGKIPEGREANLIHDGPAAAYAIANWPTPIIFSGWEIGQEIMTGAKLRQVPEGTPVRRAYELYNGLNNRQSWDQTAVLSLARPELFQFQHRGCLERSPEGRVFWNPDVEKPESNSTIGCRVLSVDRPRLLHFDWRGSDEVADVMNVPGAEVTDVTVQLFPTLTGTRLELVHAGWGDGPDWERARDWFAHAWEGAFERLRGAMHQSEAEAW
jgi:hypothetical protein